MRGLGETVVMRGDPLEIVTELQRGGEVQRVQAPQQIEFDLCRPLERGAHQRHHGDRLQHGARPFHVFERSVIVAFTR